MNNSSNPYMNQNMSANMRGGNMRGGCGCTGNAAPAMQNSYAQQRTVPGDCGCAGNVTPAMQGSYAQRTAEIPTGNRASLLAYIDQVSFAAYEAALYLDTHPDCQNGLQYFRDHNERRNQALREYVRLYGSMDLTQAGESNEAYWQWINQPWPWEGGNC